MVGPYGLSNNFYNLANNISKLDTGIITTYAIYFTLAALTIISLVFANLLFYNSLLVGALARLIIIYFATLFFLLS